jgi:hypothetical protein
MQIKPNNIETGNIPGVEHGGDYGVFKDCVTKQLCYYHKESDTLVPMLDNILTSKHILDMEEWSQADKGFIFMDSKTNKVGLLIRH